MSEQGDVIRDETLPVVVHFSTSDDTVCTSPPDGDWNSVYYWQAPDLMTDSLFVDLLIELVDAISNQDTQRFLQLLEPSQALRDELQRWNRKRKKWFDADDKTCSLRVREACSNFCSIGDFISPYPPEESVGVVSVDVLINNESDPSGELRRRINQSIDADNALCDQEFDDADETEESQDICVEDKYASDEEEEIDEVVEANPEKPCYYPSQIEMANILKKRIDTIMWHYHNIANLSDAFDDVEFAVYTARYRMLSDQTEKRICHPDAGVLSKEELESRKECNGKKRMFMYVHSAETDTHFKKLKQDVQEKPNTLFIIVADECHWGITKDKDEKPSAHNLFINEWCKDDSPRNVVVVQISATPFNLLTQNSRLPEVACLLLYDKTSTTSSNYEAGDLLPLEREPDLEENVKRISKEVEMHVVHWSEVELKNFERGMRMKLKSTLIMADAQYRYLQVSPEGKLGVTDNERDATDFLVQGSHGIVTIKAISDKEHVRTITKDTNGRLEAKVDLQQPQSAKFEVKLDFGVGVAAFSCCDDGNHYLAVDDKENVTLQAAKVERKCGVSIMKPKHDVARVSFEFYIDQCGPAEVDLVERQYMSLNYYLSTMNCCTSSDQKIREDTFFQGIVDKAKRQNKLSKTDSTSLKIDALLCAEYCYYILHVSTYDSDDKIRQALTDYFDRSLAPQISGKLTSFFNHLKKDTKSTFIHHEAFELVRREICDEVKDNLKENLREFSKTRKLNKSKGKDEELKDREVLEASFVACLMHLPVQDLQKITEETHAIDIVKEIKQSLQENHCKKMIEIWNSIIQEYETSSIVKDLIESCKGELGKMKIVRAKSMETANQFYHTLRLARALSSLEECFEIIRDYGGIQIERQLMKSSSPFFKKLQPVNCQFKFDCCCSELKLQAGRKKCVNCKHVHKSITQYEDLENLACVLILVDKGRMGDTFPQSFDCLDLRLNYDNSREFKSSPLFLSTVIQELGRMCRYAKISTGESHAQNTPYVLVGRELFKTLKTSVGKSPAMSAISCTRADRYMTTSKSKGKASSPLRWLGYEAHKDSYDHGNKQKHPNRILLQAEPQIGKTGTYLCLIKRLRLDILGTEKVSSTTTTAFDEGSFYLHKHCDSSEEPIDNSINNDEDWQFPYWKTIENSPSLYEKAVGQGKYSIGGCFYSHDTEESPFILMKGDGQKPIKSSYNYQKTNCTDGVRAWHWYHFENCVECGRLLQGEQPVLKTIKVNIDDTPVTVTCSLPTSCLTYSRLQEQLEECWTELDWPGVLPLPYWIFHPSHRDDPRKCLLNYHHVMQEESEVASYVQIAVVRSEKFQAYRSTWGKVLAIFQLPDELPKCELGPNEGGVGYARLFIQKIAYALKLEYVFVIDDNVAMMSEAVFRPNEQATSGESVVRDENGVMRMQRCSFMRPLTHLRKIAEGKDVPPDGRIQYEPHPLKEQLEGQQFPLYSYTGPAKLFGDKPYESYGVLGLLRSIPIAVRPFAKTQVYAAFLLNVKSTVEKKVYYRPWPCWEDLRFNDDCDKAGLWVVKCNRFLFHKVQYNDWIKNLALPSVFEWKEDSTLEKRPLATELPKDLEEGIILNHLRNLVNTKGPKKCFKAQIGYEDTLSPASIVERLEVNESTEDGFTNEIPVLIVSYCASNRKTKCMMLLSSSFCAAKEKIIFITSAKDAMERWPGLTLEAISSQNGICFSSEMSDRNGQFSILSAADPRRHNLRWILIVTSFQKSDDTMMEECNTTLEENVSKEESNMDESTSFDRQQPSSQESTRSSIHESLNATACFQESLSVQTFSQVPSSGEGGLEESSSARHSVKKTPSVKRSLQESLNEATFSKELTVTERPLQELSSTKELPRENNSVKNFFPVFPSLKRPLQESPIVKPGSLQDSPSKRRKIDDYFSHQDDRPSDDVNAGRIKTNYENKETGRETSVNSATNTKVERRSQVSHEHLENSKKVKTKKKHVKDKEQRNNKGNGESKQPKVTKKKKKKIEIENSYSSTSSGHSSQGEQIVSNEEENKHTASISGVDEHEVYLIDDESNASSQTSATSVYSIQDLEENMEWKNVPETYSALTRADEDENDDNSNDSKLSGRNLVPETRTARKISPSNSAYMTGTTGITKIIVDLWREYRRMKRNKEGDLTNEQVQNSLDRFTSDELQIEDKQGYTALLKACSLPSISPHVIQYLIVKRKVDLNCKLPHFFNKHHRAAEGLIPGMSALSVAIRRKGNANCISTFMRRQTEIDVRDADQEGNTALHHCVLSVSKSAFQKLFPLFRPLDWIEMRNNEGSSPLDIAWNLTRERILKKKQALKYILEEMEERELSGVFGEDSPDVESEEG